MKSSRLLAGTAALLGAVLFYGCATIFTGTSQNVSINSAPEKATYEVKTLTGAEIAGGATPGTVTLAKKNQYVVTVKLAGYNDATVAINQSLQGWFWGNLICGGVVGMIIDYVDGAMWDLEPNQVMVTLVNATSYNQQNRVYAVFRAYDDRGQLKTLVVPMIRTQRLAQKGL